VIVPTSNTVYRNGLNRQLFTAFIALIEERMETHELESAKDYRLENLQGSGPASRAWRGLLHLRRSLWGAIGRLSADRAHLSRADDRGDPGARGRAAQ
jgi:predicted ATPase